MNDEDAKRLQELKKLFKSEVERSVAFVVSQFDEQDKERVCLELDLIMDGFLTYTYGISCRSKKDKKIWDVWIEGYVATGERGTAWCKGTFEGETFKDAVISSIMKEEEKYFDPEKLTYWGCRFFPSEKEARASCG